MLEWNDILFLLVLHPVNVEFATNSANANVVNANKTVFKYKIKIYLTVIYPCIIKLLYCCKHNHIEASSLLTLDYRISQETDHELLNEALGYITWEKNMYSD